MFKNIRRVLLAGIFFQTINVMAMDVRSIEATSLFYGPAACAVNENIASVLVNPAGLYHILNTEFMLNFDHGYGFNYIGAGHFFHGLGNLALAGFNDLAANRQTMALGWALRIGEIRKGVYQHLFIAGLNVQTVFSYPSVFFSMNPGFLYLLRSEEKGLRDLSIGIATMGLFDPSTSPSWQAGISIAFKILKQNDLVLSIGTDFDSHFQQKKWSCGMEMEIAKPVYIGFGGGNDLVTAAFNFKWVNDIVYLTGMYNYITKDMKGDITYRRIILGAGMQELYKKKSTGNRKTVHKNIDNPKAKQQQVPQVTQEMLERQKDLLQEGIQLYTDNELYPAMEKWKKVLEISPDTEYGKQAAGYTNICGVELKGLKSK